MVLSGKGDIFKLDFQSGSRYFLFLGSKMMEFAKVVQMNVVATGKTDISKKESLQNVLVCKSYGHFTLLPGQKNHSVKN